MLESALGFLKCTVAPDESQIRQGVREFLGCHGGVGEHACAGMAFADGVKSSFIGGQSEPLPTPEVGWWRIELLDV